MRKCSSAVPSQCDSLDAYDTTHLQTDELTVATWLPFYNVSCRYAFDMCFLATMPHLGAKHERNHTVMVFSASPCDDDEYIEVHKAISSSNMNAIPTDTQRDIHFRAP